MKQLPYYPYYPRDFSESEAVLAMNLSEVGLYQLCLNYAWEHGHIPADPSELARRIRQDPKIVKSAWKKVAPCWVPNGTPGLLVNVRMEEVRSDVSRTLSTERVKRFRERKRNVSETVSETRETVTETQVKPFQVCFYDVSETVSSVSPLVPPLLSPSHSPSYPPPIPSQTQTQKRFRFTEMRQILTQRKDSKLSVLGIRVSKPGSEIAARSTSTSWPILLTQYERPRPWISVRRSG